MNKELIKSRFAKRLNTYNDNARIQKQMAEKIIKLLPSKEFGSILEIGCGTGLLTERLAVKVEYEEYQALDIVPECEAFIKNINSNILFLYDDIENYIEKTEKQYDLIISNAAIQWIENLPEFIEKTTAKLNQGGTLLFSIFGRENFREISYVLEKSLKYYSAQELQKLLNKYSPLIEEEVRIMAFESPKDVLKHIQSTGVNAITSEVWTKKDLINFEKEYNIFCSNHPTLTYNPIYINIKK